MPRLRVLHASDLHMGGVPNRIGIPEVLKAPANYPINQWQAVSTHSDLHADAFAAWVYANAASFELVLVSGDLATTGYAFDLQTAHEYLFSPAVRGYLNAQNRPTLQTTGKPTVVIPGNHDRFGSNHLPGDHNFDAQFGAAWSAGQGAQVLFNQSIGGVQFVLIGADFSLRAGDLGGAIYGMPLGFLGRGRVYPNRLQQLVALTQQQRRTFKDCVVIWVIHFEPDQANSSLELLDEQLVAQALHQLDRAGVEVDAILCGHTHETNVNKIFGNANVYVSGTATQYASLSGNGFLVLDIDYHSSTNLTITPTTYRYDSARGVFA